MAIGNINTTGKIVFDPELKVTPNGMTVWSARIVISRRKKNQTTGEWEDNGSPFLDVVAFGDFAANIAEQNFQKGDNVIIIGQLKQDNWEKDGQKRSKISVILDEIGRAVSRFADSGVNTQNNFNNGPSVNVQGNNSTMNSNQVADAFGGSLLDENPPF